MLQSVGTFRHILMIVHILFSMRSFQLPAGEAETDDVIFDNRTSRSNNQSLTDVLETSVNTIVNILDNIEVISQDQMGKNPEESVINDYTNAKFRVRRDTEYQEFACNVQCFIKEATPYGRMITFGVKKHFVLECLPLGAHNPETYLFPISISCVSHFTGSLIHVILNVEKGVRSDLEDGQVTIGDKFSETLSTIGLFSGLNKEMELIGLYLTLNIPVTEINFKDFQYLRLRLKYIALNGEYLKSLDETLLSRLNLNYFVLEGCTRHELILDPHKTAKIENREAMKCRVVWRFTCPNSVTLEVLAGNKTQEKLCGTNSGTDDTLVSTERKQRKKRSPRFRTDPSSVVTPAYWKPSTVASIGSQSISSTIVVHVDKKPGNDEADTKRDILWYRTAILVLVALLSVIIVIMTLIMIATWILLRHTLREKIKPV